MPRLRLLFWIVCALHLIRTIPGQQDTFFDNRVIEKSASCDRANIYFQISFERPFRGLIYTDGTFGSVRCTYVDGNTFSRVRYNITIPLNDCRSQTLPNGTGQNVVVVQRDARILEASDNLFVLSCNSGNGPSGTGPFDAGSVGRSQFTLSFAGITVRGTLASTEVVTSSFTSLDYTAEVQLGQGPFGRRLDRALGVGEAISYVVRLKKLPANTDARIGRCWATDGVTDASRTEIQLSDDDGCAVLAGANIWNNFRSATDSNNGKILYADIKAWAFPTSNRVNIFCNLHLCPGVCPSGVCRQKDEKPGLSSGNRTGSGRQEFLRLRRADTEEDVVARIESGYMITIERRLRDVSRFDSMLITSSIDRSKIDNVSARDQQIDPHEIDLRKVCLSQTSFVIGVVMLLIIIGASFMFIVYLLCKVAGRKHMKRFWWTNTIYDVMRRRLSTHSNNVECESTVSMREEHVKV